MCLWGDFTTRSTQPKLHVDICSMCHPFFTGKQKILDAEGRVEKFKKKYAKRISRYARNLKSSRHYVRTAFLLGVSRCLIKQ